MATFDILFPMGQTKFTLNIYLSIIYFETRHKVSDIDQNAQWQQLYKMFMQEYIP